MTATAPAKRPMTADEFLAWAESQPRRQELHAGEVFAMSPERLEHNEVKTAVWGGLNDGIRRAGLPCSALGDGMSVRVDETTVYEPDAQLRCGPRLPKGTIEIPDPLVVVEVASPSSSRIDKAIKLEGYFRIPSVRHYLIVAVEHRKIIHHRRGDDGTITTTVLAGGTLTLDPPGLSLDVAACFPE
ncbi:MAG: Uma2 family endonuclease [Geminicoccaceae bacterium]